MKSVFPWFILGFLALCVNSLGFIPACHLRAQGHQRSFFQRLPALVAIGLNTSLTCAGRASKPMLQFIYHLCSSLVAIAVEYAIGVAPSGTLR